MSGEKTKRVAVRVNGALSKANLLFLFFIPIFGILQALHITAYANREMAVIMALFFVFSVVPACADRLLYNDELITKVTLLSMEALLILISLNSLAEVSILYVLLPIVSLLYCDLQLTQYACVIGYLGMIGGYVCRFELLESGCGFADQAEAVYLEILKLSLEYLAVCLIIYLSGRFFKNSLILLLSSESGDGQAAEALPVQTGRTAAAGISEQVYDVQRLFYGIEKDLCAMIKGKDKKFTVDLDTHLPVKLYGAREEIRKAVTGVCSDLLMYGSESAVELHVTYDSGVVPKKKQNISLIMRIKANTDISADIAAKRALGYYLSQSVVTELSGSIEDLSGDQGTVFRLCVLQRVEDERSIRDRKNMELQNLQRFRSEGGRSRESMFRRQIKVLVVDDNRESCKLIDSILTMMGIKVRSVNNGAAAIEILENKEYDLVFIDQMMPEKSGIETVKELRYMEDAYFADLPIILMAVNTNDDARKRYADLGFTDYISKPVSSAELRESLHKWIKDDYPMTYAEYRQLQESDNEE